MFSSARMFGSKDRWPSVAVHEMTANFGRHILAWTKGCPSSHDVETVSRFYLTWIQNEEEYCGARMSALLHG